MKRSELFFTFLLVPLDYLLILVAFALAYSTRIQYPVQYVWTFLDYFRFATIYALIWIMVFGSVGLYTIQTPRQPFDELRKVFIGVSTGVMLLVVWFFLSRTEFFSRLVILYTWLYSILLVFAGRLLIHGIQQYLVRFEIGVHRVLVIGQNGLAKEVVKTIQQNRSLGFKLVKLLDRQAVSRLESIANKQPIDEIILSDVNLTDEDVNRVMEFCQQSGYTLRVIPNLYRIHTNVSLETIAGVPIIEFERSPLRGWGKIIKRLTDIVGATAALVILSPLFLIATVGIKLSSPTGGVIFRQKRLGFRGQFTFYKLRTMVPDANKLHEKYIKQYGNMFKLRNDPRIFAFGRFLRRYSIDEIPQFWNVLIGNMSLVGPRPPMPEEVKHYTSWEKKRFGVKPGITGLWQVSGRSDLDFDEWVKLDIYYIEHWSFWLDFQILLKTIWVVLFRKGAY